MQADIGDRVEPVAQLGIEVVEIAEVTGQEEVLADIAEGPLDLALRLGPIGPAGFGLEAVVLGQGEQGPVVDDVALAILARDGRLHAVIEDLERHAAEGRKSQHMAAQQGLQILVHDKAGEDVARVAEHQGEQPDDAGHLRLVAEGGDEAGEVDLGLLAGRRLEADLEGPGDRRDGLWRGSASRPCRRPGTRTRGSRG